MPRLIKLIEAMIGFNIPARFPRMQYFKIVSDIPPLDNICTKIFVA